MYFSGVEVFSQSEAHNSTYGHGGSAPRAAAPDGAITVETGQGLAAHENTLDAHKHAQTEQFLFRAVTSDARSGQRL